MVEGPPDEAEAGEVVTTTSGGQGGRRQTRLDEESGDFR